MPYEIRLRMISQSKAIHAMHMYNHVMKLCAKFGMGNFTEIELYNNDTYTTYARYEATPMLAHDLKKDFEDEAQKHAQTASVIKALQFEDDDKVN